jgi:hypothetical protein
MAHSLSPQQVLSRMRLHSGAAVAPAPAPPDPPGPGPPGPPWGALGTSSRPSSWEAYHSSGFPPALAQHGPGERPCTARASRPPARGSRPGPARAAPARRRAAPAIKHVMCVICDTRVSLALCNTLYYTGLAQLRGEGAGAGAGDPVVREESSSSGAAHRWQAADPAGRLGAASQGQVGGSGATLQPRPLRVLR